MRRPLILLSLVLLGAAAAGPAAAACSMPGGIGGTGVTADGGIGGTGIRAEGGIGGTGQRADIDLSVIGVVTGFGSICVNGVEVHYDASTPVTHDGEPSSARALAIGHVVALHAFGNSAEARARAIDVRSAAVGRVTAIERSSNSLNVLGQTVRVEPWTTMGPGLAGPTLADVGLGESLRVSGLRRADGTIIATRIERATSAKEIEGMPAETTRLENGAFIVQGYVAGATAGGEVRVGGMPFRVPERIAAQLTRDRLVRLSGRTESGGVRVVDRADILTAPLDPRPERTLGASGGRPGEGGRGGRGEDDDRRGRDSGSGENDRGNSGPGSGADRGGADRPDNSGPGRGGADRVERPERGGGSSRPERPERSERSGRH
jgi:hypothetical protein